VERIALFSCKIESNYEVKNKIYKIAKKLYILFCVNGEVDNGEKDICGEMANAIVIYFCFFPFIYSSLFLILSHQIFSKLIPTLFLSYT
jgi:hypothetical protein